MIFKIVDKEVKDDTVQLIARIMPSGNFVVLDAVSKSALFGIDKDTGMLERYPSANASNLERCGVQFDNRGRIQMQGE